MEAKSLSPAVLLERGVRKKRRVCGRGPRPLTAGPWRRSGPGVVVVFSACRGRTPPPARPPPPPARAGRRLSLSVAPCAPRCSAARSAPVNRALFPYSLFSRGEARARTVLALLRAALGRSFVALLRGRSRSTPAAGEGVSSMASPSRGEALVAAAAAPAGAVVVAKPQEVVVRRPPTVTGPERRRAGLHARAFTSAPILIARAASLASTTWTRATATARRTTSCTRTG